MCGICGKLYFDRSEVVDKNLIERMTQKLRHRGPDDEGIFLSGNIGLGHRRLSIIDLSKAGHQPMQNDDKTLSIVFNGEIYNFREIRKDLEGKGYTFFSNTDTEVLLKLYEDIGPSCLEKLRGMFAFAIWNERDKSLFLARDRVGQKPLYFSRNNNFISFASEMKSLLQDKDIEKVINPNAIHHYLSFQYIPHPLSIFQNIEKLPPAHSMICKDGKCEIQRYWKLSYQNKFIIKTKHEEKALQEKLLDELKTAIKIRMISDVPKGVFLSGGIDSSAIVAMMHMLGEKDIRTFSAAFKESAYNEGNFARIVANQYKTDHTEFVITPDIETILPKIVSLYDEPYADDSAIPMYYLSELAKEHVTVVLNGDGGDENFAGYERYIAYEMSRCIQKYCPERFIQLITPIVKKIPHGNSKGVIWKLKRFLEAFAKPPEIKNAQWMFLFQSSQKEQLYSKDFLANTSLADSFDVLMTKYFQADSNDFLDKILYADIAMCLPDAFLTKVDRATMAHSLEARSPFLDHIFMEFSARIPAKYKIQFHSGKHILKKTLLDILPHPILYRKKMGFTLPFDSWFKDELKNFVYDELLSKKSIERGYFNKNFISKLLNEHTGNIWNWEKQIYSLLMLEIWFQTFDNEFSYM